MGESAAEYYVVDVLQRLGVDAARSDDGHDDGDLTLKTPIGGMPLELKVWNSFPDSAPFRNEHLRRPPREGVARMVVADRISESSRGDLDGLGWGWLDRRGHIKLRAPGLIIDSDFPVERERTPRSDAFAGRAGLEVACALLDGREPPASLRSLAHQIGRSPSTVHEVVGSLRNEGLLSEGGLDPDHELFWRTVGAWHSAVHLLASAPDTAKETPSDWVLTGSWAASLYGAPEVRTTAAIREFYVPNATAARRADLTWGRADTPYSARAVLKVAPVAAACEWPERTLAPWPVARKFYIMLDLAASGERGRRIVQEWIERDQAWQSLSKSV